eukprot:gene20914-25631_t
MMVLYSGTTDPYSHRCRFVLFEKGMDFEIRDVDLFAKPEDIALMNPYNEVPILVERDLILYESHIINEYIDERFPHPQLMPGDPVARARVRLFLLNFEKELFVHVNTLESRAAKSNEKASPLEQFTQNLNQMAKDGKIDPLIGREYEVERVIQILCRRRKNNPLLVGEAGVGKTAIAEGL